MLLEMSNDRVIDTLHPRLLGLLDNSHSPVRVAAAGTLRTLISLSHDLGLSSLEDITSCLLIHLDDPDPATQESVLACLLELQYQDAYGNKGVIEMMERQIKRDQLMQTCSDFKPNYRHVLLEKVQVRSAGLQSESSN